MRFFSNEGAAEMAKHGEKRTWLGGFTLSLLLLVFPLMGCGGTSDTKSQATASAGGDETVGALDGFDAVSIHGWAWDPKQPNAAIKLDIYDGDTKLATVLADEERADLVKDKLGNGKHAFTYPIPANLKDGKEHTIRLKVSGSNKELEQSPKTYKSS
jgi:hypothetical protein